MWGSVKYTVVGVIIPVSPMVGAGGRPWLVAVVGSGGGRRWVVVVAGSGGRRWAVVVVVGERAGDVTASHDQPDLAGIGLQAVRCPQ
jgi:hypothetical protein